MSAAPSWVVPAEYALLGAAAGVLAGMLGIGGGLIVVPALLFLFRLQSFPPDLTMHLAVATSLASIVFTAISSSWSHHRRGAVLWPQVWPLAPGIVAGAAAGAMVADRLHGGTMRALFGIFECLVAAQLVWDRVPAPHRRLPGAAGMTAAGAVIGALSSLFGIGGGTLTVPFLVWCNVNIRNAVATSAACGLPLAISGTLAMAAAGWDRPGLPVGATGYVYWPAALAVAAVSVPAAPIGAHLAHALPIPALRRAFAAFLLLVGLRLLWPA